MILSNFKIKQISIAHPTSILMHSISQSVNQPVIAKLISISVDWFCSHERTALEDDELQVDAEDADDDRFNQLKAWPPY